MDSKSKLAIFLLDASKALIVFAGLSFAFPKVFIPISIGICVVILIRILFEIFKPGTK